ncbi:MAG: transposase [Phycisphaerales bacterium]
MKSSNQSKNGLPMKWIANDLFHGGHYEHPSFYFGMERYYTPVFVDFYPTHGPDFPQPAHRLDSVYGPPNHYRYFFPFADPLVKHAHDAYHRFFSKARWVIGDLWRMLAVTLIRQLRPKGIVLLALDDTLFHHSGKKINGAGLFAGRRAFEQKQYCLCLGSESGPADLADSAALGRRTPGPAGQHATASQKRPYPNRIGPGYDQGGQSMDARKAFSAGWGRLLCLPGRRGIASNIPDIPDEAQCQTLRSASQDSNQTTRQTPQFVNQFITLFLFVCLLGHSKFLVHIRLTYL